MNQSHDTVVPLGIRHHGPGSARSVSAALDELDPDLVLVEGAPELDAVVHLMGEDQMVPPVAGLVYAVDHPRRASFYPFASFSPEWVAVRWALRHERPVRFADLPATHELSAPPDDVEDSAEDPEEDASQVPPHTMPTRDHDPLGQLAAAAGYDDPERWWEDAVEHRATSTLARFASICEAVRAVRDGDERDQAEPAVLENAQREAAMRRAVRLAWKQGFSRVGFVCGAYHAPALQAGSFPSAGHDNRLLSGLPRTKVAATWTPWTAGRLALASGYGAGVASPGWYQHLFDHWAGEADPREVGTTWMVRVARELRTEQLDASTASVIEAARLAETLAVLRGRPSVGLAELDDAARSVLCDGSSRPLELIHARLVVGESLGTVPDSTPTVPIATDLARQQRSLRLKPTASQTTVVLDLRRESGRARSVLLHRLSLLDVDWGVLDTEAPRSTGTFKESWLLTWEPELAVALVEAGMYGTTVREAAAAKVTTQAATSDDLGVLSRLAADCLVADLPDALDKVVVALDERSARQHDVLALMETVEPLARTCRYGDVRGVDTEAVIALLTGIVRRVAVGLVAACGGTDDDAAAELQAGIDTTDRGVLLLDDESLKGPWQAALTSVAVHDLVPGGVSGRANRILLDGGVVEAEEVGRRMSRRLSVAAPAPVAASWLDGFLSGDAALLVHDPSLLGIIDSWVVGIGEETFDDLLPLLRRTFARFSFQERREIAYQVHRTGVSSPGRGNDQSYDIERARPAVANLARLLGLEVTT